MPGSSPRHPKPIHGASPSTLEQRKSTCDPTVGQKVTKVGRKSTQRAQSGPSWNQKSTKNRPGAKKSLPKMAPKAVSIDFLAGLRSKSHSRSILRRSEPSKSYYFHSGSTIFTKSRFSFFLRILTPNGTPNSFILAKNARREIQNHQNNRKK